MLLKAIADVQAGGTPPLAVNAAEAERLRGPGSIDVIGPAEGWERFWQAQDAERRKATPWPASFPQVV
jgi:hypothetical protein